MIKNYLITALRNIYRQKIFSFINVFGLAIGMASSILIFLWVKDELAFDRFNKNIDNMYLVAQTQFYQGGELSSHYGTPGLLSEALKKEYPEIINSTRIGSANEILFNYENNKFYENNGLAVDPSFFQMFTFPFLDGEANTSFSDPYSIVLTEKLAKKYFGNEDPLNKFIEVNNISNLKVTGVIQNVPGNSSVKFDFLIPFSLMEIVDGFHVNHWGYNWYLTCLLLQENVNYSELGDKIKYRLQPEYDTSAELFLWPLKDMHSRALKGPDPILGVYLFSLVAFLILVIACINFMNLSTARFIDRTKEVGIRKVVGARRIKLVRQFIGE